jgi:carboxymethylenebutenolidase
MFYSRIVTDAAMLRQLGGPVLAVFAERERDWPDKMVDFERAMTRAGKDLRPVSFDAAHGFVNPAGSRYDEEAADDAWDATCVFLDEVVPPA